jgi:hypothetical protein
MLKELDILGDELKLSQAIPGYDDALAEIKKVQTYAFADLLLQSNGEPRRYSVHKGQNSLVQPQLSTARRKC